MDARVEDEDLLFQEILQHLQSIQATPTTQLDEELLRRGERSLDTGTPRTLLWQVLGTGENLLQSLQQDPRPLTRLLEKTVLLIPFDELRTAITPEKLIDGLNSSSVPIRLLCLAYLRRASDTPSASSFVACSPILVKTLVTIWLSTESTEVAERAQETLVLLLVVDNPGTTTIVTSNEVVGEADGQGLLWRRVFHDADIYSLLFEWTSLKSSNFDLTTKKGQQGVTIAQARLFDFIAQIAAQDWTLITTSLHPAVEQQYSKAVGNNDEHVFGGLLKYAANGMVDQTDFLMEVLRQDFFAKLVGVIEETNSKGLSPRLITAIQEGAGIQEQNGDSGVNGVNL